jgi:hypothetical protein
MTRNLQRRLQKLESQVPRQPTEQEKQRKIVQNFLICAVAYYLGDPTPAGSVAEAYRRALGYPNAYEFQKAIDANDCKIWRKPEHEREEILEASQRMEWLSRAVQSVLPPKKYTGRDHAI